ncbi:MAG: hypothetical protein Unbinned8210contig1002_9 [Prokaryotic dsDNA virus sp.]|nr:MAG: hypothetical protein Unbinned8210contig1002_9 [Prokaryotic dsDNA virus sp.]|tara:strand:+ start:10120 stop:10662 length:543 start_codon:yes stop_codon:yes gene_type:complete
MADQYKFIKDALKKEAPYIISELQKELDHQQHIASGTLYKGFRDIIKIGSDTISLLITNDTPYMWLVNDGKKSGVNASYNAILEWVYEKEGRGMLTFSSNHERANFVQKVKHNLENNYFTRTGDMNVPPYGYKRYFFIDIAAHKVRQSKIEDRIKEGIVAEIEDAVNKALLKEEITLTIG